MLSSLRPRLLILISCGLAPLGCGKTAATSDEATSGGQGNTDDASSGADSAMAGASGGAAPGGTDPGAGAPAGGRGSGGVPDATGPLSPACPDLRDPELIESIRALAALPEGSGLDARGAAQLANLTANGVRSLEGLSCLMNLTSLALHESPELFELSPLAAIPSLRTIQLYEIGATDYSALQDLEELHVVTVTNSPVANLTAFAALPNLELLSLVGTEASDLTPLLASSSLTSISIIRSQLTSLAPLLDWNITPGELSVQDNPLSDAVFSEQIPGLVERGWCVRTGTSEETVEHPPECSEPDKP